MRQVRPEVHCSEEDLKMLAYVQGLTDTKDANILKKLLEKLDAYYTQLEAAADPATVPKLDLNSLVGTCDRMQQAEREKTMIEQPETVKQEVFYVQKKPPQSRNGNRRSRYYTRKSSREGEPHSQYSTARSQQQPSRQYDNRSTGSQRGQQQSTRQSDYRYGGSQQGQQQRSQGNPGPSTPCWGCNGDHWRNDCSFNGKTCSKCNGRDHAPHCCESYRRKEQELRRKRSNWHRQSLAISAGNTDAKKFVSASLLGERVKLQHDSGSDWTIISQANWTRLGEPTLAAHRGQATSASGDPMQILGSFQATMRVGDHEGSGTIYVTPLQLNLFGNEWMTALDLWDVPPSAYCLNVSASPVDKHQPLEEEVQSKFPLLFSDTLGRCNRMKASLTLLPETMPIYRRTRPVPHAAIQQVEDELMRLQSLGVIEPTTFSDYAAPIVVVKKKDGKLRITADYSTGLNDALEPNRYPLPTQEGIMAKFAGNTIFTVIDMSDAFLQIELDDEAKKLMTINTHCGLFQVNRLQPGVKTAPGIFQQLMDTMTEDLDGALPWADDIIIGGKNVDQHRERLFSVLDRMQDYGFRLKLAKCAFGQKSVKFLSHIIDASGVRPDPERLKVVQQLPTPTDVSQLRAFLGAVTWYGKFIPELKSMRGSLDQLLQDDTEFAWTAERDADFHKIKEALATDLALVHFDPDRKIVVAADASSYGWGGVLMHKFDNGSLKPVWHVSGSFTKAERNYAQVQREALALVRTLKKFHRFVYGQHFELQTDHQPLLIIFGAKTGIPVYTAARLQRYAETLLAYDFTIKYVKTESFAYADFISRLIASQEPLESEETVIAAIRAEEQNCFAVQTAQSLPVTFADIQKATAEDDALQEVMRYVANGWPQERKHIREPNAAQYCDIKGELTIIQNCLFRGDRIVVPLEFRSTLLRELHEGHPGAVRMTMLARSKFYWPRIGADIEETAKRCQTCAINAKTPAQCTLQAWPYPSGPWSRIHVDFAGPIDGYSFFVVVDAYSNWPEIDIMRSTTAAKTIDRLCEAFSRQGLCETIVSDNGPQFTSGEFDQFCKNNGIAHVRSAPYHPQSNGRAERFVGLLKTALAKLEGQGNLEQIVRKFLSCYRFTPSPALGNKSPFQLMTGREMRTRLDLVRPPPEHSDVRDTDMEERYDAHHGAAWREFKAGDCIFFKRLPGDKKWHPGIVLAKHGAVNYTIDNGERFFKCHASQLKLRHTEAPQPNEDALLDEFELTPLRTLEVEPLVIPQQPDEPAGENDNLSLYEDAEDAFSDDDAELEQEEAAAPLMGGRYPVREHRGPPEHFRY